jgi:hypothetical protein
MQASRQPKDLLSESNAPAFVPCVGVGNVLLGLRGGDDPNGHVGHGLGV